MIACAIILKLVSLLTINRNYKAFPCKWSILTRHLFSLPFSRDRESYQPQSIAHLPPQIGESSQLHHHPMEPESKLAFVFLFEVKVKKVLFAFLVVTLQTTSAFAESGIQYHYGRLNAKYQNYTGRRAEVNMPVHELSILDASGNLSAGLSNASAQYAAREGAIAETKERVREGKEIGGPKTITYSWKETAAQEGDVKRYGLRLASTKNVFSFDPIFGSNAEKYSSMAEIYMIGTMTNDLLLATDSFLLRGNLFFGARWGAFRDADRTPTGPALNEDRKVDTGYITLPLTYRLGLILPFGLQLYFEAGLDPITLVRHQFMKHDQKIPNDILITPAVEYRVHENVGIGARVEEYRGSFIRWTRYKVYNPEYKQRMATVYVNFSE